MTLYALILFLRQRSMVTLKKYKCTYIISLLVDEVGEYTLERLQRKDKKYFPLNFRSK